MIIKLFQFSIYFAKEDDDEDEDDESGTDEDSNNKSSASYTIKYTNEVSTIPTRITLQLSAQNLQSAESMVMPTPIKKGRRGKIQRRKVFDNTVRLKTFIYQDHFYFILL